MSRRLLVAAGSLLMLGVLHAAPSDVAVSTVPMGSPYVRHLAFDQKTDIRLLAHCEKRGFGRTEMALLTMLSASSGRPLSDFARRRIARKPATLEDMARDLGLDFPTLLRAAQSLKKSIEARGSEGLPPPVFELPGDKPPFDIDSNTEATAP